MQSVVQGIVYGQRDGFGHVRIHLNVDVYNESQSALHIEDLHKLPLVIAWYGDFPLAEQHV